MLSRVSLKKYILKYSPPLFLDAACSYIGYRKKRQRHGGDYEKYYDFYRNAAKWPESQLIDFQNKRLRDIIKYCYSNVPYYRDIFKDNNLHPEDIATIEDLHKLPFIDKMKVRELGPLLVSNEYDSKKLLSSSTGGSTGTPMKIYYSHETWPAQYGFFWARWRPGVTKHDRYACFQGQELVAPDQKKPPFWRTNLIATQRLYSVFHLHEDKLHHYVENLNSFRPIYIQGYPSAMYILADYMRRNNLCFTFPLKAAYSMSETVLPYHKQAIEEVWGCRLWDQYGQGERVASITLYECGNYHYDMDFGIIEFLKVGQQEGLQVAEIIGTSLINKAWTLLRYRTGDLVLFDPEARCSCGRPGPVIKAILGRTGDIIITPDGRRIMNVTTAVKDIPGIKEFQVVQKTPSEIIVNIVATNEYSIDSGKLLLNKLGDRLGPSVNLKIDLLDEIKRTKGGKFKAIVAMA